MWGAVNDRERSAQPQHADSETLPSPNHVSEHQQASWGLPCLGGTAVAGETAWEGHIDCPTAAAYRKMGLKGHYNVLTALTRQKSKS